MSDQLRTLLHEAAPTPTGPVDPEQIHATRRRRDRARIAAGTSLAVIAAALVIAGLPTAATDSPVIDQAPPADTTPTTPAHTEAADDPLATAQRLAWPDGPSQSATAAEAQGVPAEVAALPLAERIELQDGTAAREGLYVTSHLPQEVGERIAGEDGRLLDGTGWAAYEEILLLDPDTLQIVRAWPTAGLSTTGAPLVLDAPAVVATLRVGDGAEPWSSLILIDRDSGERRGFVTTPPPEAGPVDSPWTDADWIQTDVATLPEELLGALGGKLAGVETGDIVTYDHTTMTADTRFDIDSGASLLSPVGDGIVVERGERPARFFDVATTGATPSLTLPDLPGYAVGASTTADQPIAVTFDDGRRTVWALEDGQWQRVAESRQEVRLHIVDGRTYVTIENRLLHGGTPVAERPTSSAPQQGPSADVVAGQASGRLLWIARDVPYTVDVSSLPTSDDRAPELTELEKESAALEERLRTQRNEWLTMTPAEARAEVPWLQRLPAQRLLPDSVGWDGTVAVLLWDQDDDGDVDLHRVAITMSTSNSPTDRSGHGNIQIVPARSPQGPPPEAPAATDQLSDGRTVAVTDDGSAVQGTWWEHGVYYQVTGGDRSTVLQIAEAMVTE